MTRSSYLRLELPGATEAHRPEAIGACFQAATAPIVPLADFWERPPTREAPERALHPHPRLERLARLQGRSPAELEADVHLVASNKFRECIAVAAAFLAYARAGHVLERAPCGCPGVLPWQIFVDAYGESCAFVDVALGWDEAAE